MNQAKRICNRHRVVYDPDVGCPKCATQKRPKDTRPNAAARGYDRRWREHYRDPYLAEHPLCEECEREGIVKAATDVDHIVPHNGDITLLYDFSNFQALCGMHHRRKTTRERSQARETPSGDG